MNKNKSHIKPALIAVIAVIVVIFALISILAAYLLIYKPQVDHTVPFETGSASTNEPAAPQTSETTSDGKPSAPTTTEAAAPGNVYTRRPDVYNFLVAGLDEVNENHTDVLMLASYDLAKGTVSVLSIPRDTYINVGRNFYKINSYFTGEYNRNLKYNTKMTGSEARSASMEALTSLIEQNLNIKVDYWALVNLKGFRGIVDVLGGVEVNVPMDMKYDDPEQDLHIDLKAGLQTLNGSQAEQFVRFREGYETADKGRINAQKIFVTALLNAVKTKVSLSNVADLVKQITDNLLTSIEAKDFVYFAKSVYSVDFSDILFVTLPGEGAQSPDTGAWYEVMYRADALAVINKYFNVYDKPITDAIFDADRVFTNSALPYISSVYQTPASKLDDPSTAADISDDKLKIY